MQNFRLYEERDASRALPIPKDPAVAIEGGRLVTVDVNKLAIEADATSTAVAYTQDGAPVGQDYVNVIFDPKVLLVGTADANFASTDLYLEVDVVMSGSDQLIDLGASTTDVLKVIPNAFDTGVNVVGQAEDVLVKINKHLLEVI